jgi:hypothetical protein
LLLDHFDVEQIRVVKLNGPESRIGVVSAEQMEAIRDGLLEPGELLTVDPARMQPVASGAFRARNLRSFRRLESAVSSLLQAIRCGKPIASPS